jgi:hypothetical protein
VVVVVCFMSRRPAEERRRVAATVLSGMMLLVAVLMMVVAAEMVVVGRERGQVMMAVIRMAKRASHRHATTRHGHKVAGIPPGERLPIFGQRGAGADVRQAEVRRMRAQKVPEPLPRAALLLQAGGDVD